MMKLMNFSSKPHKHNNVYPSMIILLSRNHFNLISNNISIYLRNPWANAVMLRDILTTFSENNPLCRSFAFLSVIHHPFTDSFNYFFDNKVSTI